MFMHNKSLHLQHVCIATIWFFLCYTAHTPLTSHDKHIFLFTFKGCGNEYKVESGAVLFIY